MNETINVILTAYFAFDMAVKVIGLGMSGYLKDRMNAFDGVIVIASLAELAISAASPGGSSSSLSVLRTFRLLRVFKLARSWNELNKIVRTIFKSLASIAYLSLILLLFIFIVALLGMQLFGFKCAPARSFFTDRLFTCFLLHSLFFITRVMTEYFLYASSKFALFVVVNHPQNVYLLT